MGLYRTRQKMGGDMRVFTSNVVVVVKQQSLSQVFEMT